MKLASKKEKKLKTKPWITKGILDSRKTKTELYKLGLNGTTENLAQYKVYRNKLTHLKELSKRNYFKIIINTYKNDTKLLWKTINDIVK